MAHSCIPPDHVTSTVAVVPLGTVAPQISEAMLLAPPVWAAASGDAVMPPILTLDTTRPLAVAWRPWTLTMTNRSAAAVPIGTAVRHCAALGFDGLELTVIPGWSTDAAHLTPEDRRRIREIYDENKIELCGFSGNVELLSPDWPAVRAQFCRKRFCPRNDRAVRSRVV